MGSKFYENKKKKTQFNFVGENSFFSHFRFGFFFFLPTLKDIIKFFYT